MFAPAPFGATPAERLVLACLCWPRDDARRAAIAEAAAGLGDGWGTVLALVRRHRVAPLVLDGVTAADVAPPPALLAEGARATRTALAVAAEAARLGDEMAAQGLAVVVAKGPALSMQLYGMPALREVHDLDLLVAPADFRAALARLMAGDYQQLSGPPLSASERVFDYWREGEKDVMLARRDGRVIVELHHRLVTNPHAMAPMSLADATGAVALAGATLRTLAGADLFAYLVTHGTLHHWFRLKWLADIQAMLAATDAAGIAALVAGADARGAGQAARVALILCHRLFNEPVPPALLTPDRQIARLVRRAERAIAAPDTVATGFGSLRESWRQLSAHGSWRYRHWQLTRRWRDWRLAARLPLPAMLHPLYVPIRAATWTGEKAWNTLRAARARAAAPRG
ncbi:nucleotidyltransferase family protein [Sphingomonas sp.]|uniref:nucleotidyltransferase family protein n=1 Tax=Sphingomonas sp. TaxID=28214 RepID=UPI001D323860|nr:nucleotidyltransferase family protein [Sphingomonas sp.]MBX9796711.1 nucleotidyltransferase family protein [Sphingomonas sp.]